MKRRSAGGWGAASVLSVVLLASCSASTREAREAPATTDHRIAFSIAGPPDGARLTVTRDGEVVKACSLPCALERPAAGLLELALKRQGEAVGRSYLFVDATTPSEIALPDGREASTSTITIAGRSVLVPGVRVLTWEAPTAPSLARCEPGACTFAREGAAGATARLGLEHRLEAVRRSVRMIVLHQDLAPDARASVPALLERKLGTHFLIDWDGTIYQLADPALRATRHCRRDPVDAVSIGIDLNNLSANLVRKPGAAPYAADHPDFERMSEPEFRRNRSRMVRINGGRVQHYGFTEPQHRALIALTRVLLAAFPGIPARFPVDDEGRILSEADYAIDAGIAGHWHLSATRWDPGPGLDWARYAEGIGVEPPKPLKPAPPPSEPERRRKR